MLKIVLFIFLQTNRARHPTKPNEYDTRLSRCARSNSNLRCARFHLEIHATGSTPVQLCAVKARSLPKFLFTNVEHTTTNACCQSHDRWESQSSILHPPRTIPINVNGIPTVILWLGRGSATSYSLFQNGARVSVVLRRAVFGWSRCKRNKETKDYHGTSKPYLLDMKRFLTLFFGKTTSLRVYDSRTYLLLWALVHALKCTRKLSLPSPGWWTKELTVLYEQQALVLSNQKQT